MVTKRGIVKAIYYFKLNLIWGGRGLCLGDAAVLAVVAAEVVAVPGHAGDARGLGDDGAADLVAEGAHGGAPRADEDDPGGRLGERVGEQVLLRGVAPPRPHRVHVVPAPKREREGGGGAPLRMGIGSPKISFSAAPHCELNNEHDVGVVVIVGPARNVHDLVGHADVLGVRIHIFLRRHYDELRQK